MKDKDIKSFLQLSNEENALFYKEQQRWFEEYLYLLEKGYKIEADLNGVELDSKDKGTVNFSIIMKRTNG
ncbi:hypothetical protein [Virgibacillus sp. DJP39]|uniref:hypothetical protein n=1 Tax=Virgibacillus sp. DJP39 TaxID=3409790 RepID=UPI003BB57656